MFSANYRDSLASKVVSIISAAVLVVGVFPMAAYAVSEAKINICHQTESEQNPWVAQEIDESSWSTHEGHGDFSYSGPVKDSNGKPDTSGDEWCEDNAPTPTDNTPPVFDSVSDIEEETDDENGKEITYTTPTATDDVDGLVEVTCEPTSGSVFPIGTTTVICTTEDSSENENTMEFDVIVTLVDGEDDDDSEGEGGDDIDNGPSYVEYETGSCGAVTFTATTNTSFENLYLIVDDGSVHTEALNASITVGPYEDNRTISYRVFGGPERDWDIPLWNGYGDSDFKSNINAYGGEHDWDWVIAGVDDENPFTTWNELDVTGCPDDSEDDSNDDSSDDSDDSSDDDTKTSSGGGGGGGINTVCDNNEDDDNDGLYDMNDPGCSEKSDMDESDEPVGGSGEGENEGEVAGAQACSAILHSFLGLRGKENDPEAVKIVQEFLNGELGLELEVNGEYDAATIEAVKAFQTKYSTDVLGPWGITDSTGIVYLTTQRMINMIACPSLDLPIPELN